MQAVLRHMRAGPFSKPVVLMDLVDLQAYGFPVDEKGDSSGVKNLYYLATNKAQV